MGQKKSINVMRNYLKIIIGLGWLAALGVLCSCRQATETKEQRAGAPKDRMGEWGARGENTCAGAGRKRRQGKGGKGRVNGLFYGSNS